MPPKPQTQENSQAVFTLGHVLPSAVYGGEGKSGKTKQRAYQITGPFTMCDYRSFGIPGYQE